MKLALVSDLEEKDFQKWFTEYQGDLQTLKHEDVARQAFLAGRKCAQNREKYWQVAAGKLADIGNRMYAHVDERNLTETEKAEVDHMHEIIHKYLDFDESVW